MWPGCGFECSHKFPEQTVSRCSLLHGPLHPVNLNCLLVIPISLWFRLIEKPVTSRATSLSLLPPLCAVLLFLFPFLFFLPSSFPILLYPFCSNSPSLIYPPLLFPFSPLLFLPTISFSLPYSPPLPPLLPNSPPIIPSPLHTHFTCSFWASIESFEELSLSCPNLPLWDQEPFLFWALHAHTEAALKAPLQ